MYVNLKATSRLRYGKEGEIFLPPRVQVENYRQKTPTSVYADGKRFAVLAVDITAYSRLCAVMTDTKEALFFCRHQESDAPDGRKSFGPTFPVILRQLDAKSRQREL